MSPKTPQEVELYQKGQAKGWKDAPGLLDHVRTRKADLAQAYAMGDDSEHASIFQRLALTPEWQLFRQAQGTLKGATRRKDWENIGYWESVQTYAKEEYHDQYPLFWRKVNMFFGLEHVEPQDRMAAIRILAEALANA